jgi:hemerythrin
LTINKQHETICKLTDENKALLAENSKILTEKDSLERELFKASEYILALEEKCHQAHLTSLEVLKTLKAREYEIETLKQYIIDLKARIAVYIPVKNDAIDRKLAEYINNFPDRNKLKIMFMRETEGVYEFGSRKV